MRARSRISAGQSLRDDGIVCCAVGNEQYALRGADVRHISRVERMRPAPGRDGSVGTLDVGGRTVPVFSMSRVLGRPFDSGNDPVNGRRDGNGHHIAVTGATGELVGWLVDHIARIPLSQDAEVVALPAVVGTPATMWFEALVRIGDVSMLLLAPHCLSPFATHLPRRDATAAFDAPVATVAPRPEPMVVMFSTPVLPRCEVPRYAISGRQIAAVVQPLPTIVVPGSARHVTGVAWWRNAVVPVIDFREADSREEGPPALRRCLIAQCGTRLGGALIAFGIDSEIALHRPSAENREVIDVPRPAFAAGMFDVDGSVVALLDLDALLGTEVAQSEPLTA